MRDFLPEDVRRRQYVIDVIADVYQKYGFEPLETPAVENLDTLQGKYGEEGDRLIFKILKRGEGAETGQADLALRYDLTVPLARVVAEYRAKLPKFFKRYQVQPVWRADRPQKGRFREFYQCDVDAIGSKSMVVEAELLAAATEVLIALGFGDFRIRINHRGVLNGQMRVARLGADVAKLVLVALDKFDKIGLGGVRDELLKAGIDPEIATLLVNAFGIAGPEFVASGQETNSRALKAGFDFFANDTEGAASLQELSRIIELTEQTPAKGKVIIDFSLARGLSYYTGAIFEIHVPEMTGSLAGGGRYDELIGMFSGESVPACGISLGLERILVVMAERGMFPPSLASTPADVMVVQWFANRTDLYLSFATELRAAGLRVELYPEAPTEDGKKVGDKQFKYASARGIPYVVVIGADELENSSVTVKNMKTGDQTKVPRSTVAQWLSAAANP
jgi:histidyl-tRNA synthetase